MIQPFDPAILHTVYKAPLGSHKGQNGKLLLIGGSQLFHSASLWALEVASRIVDMVYYASVPANNMLVQEAKEAFRDGIVIPRGKIPEYIAEADCILIGPGLPRLLGQEAGDDDTQSLTSSLLAQYKEKKWVIDGGSLQVITPDLIPAHAIVTPHHGEFARIFGVVLPEDVTQVAELVQEKATAYNCTIVLKGQIDLLCTPTACMSVSGGNAGMTKGGTGDVLAGLIAALYCKNDAITAATVGSYLNKKAAESLEQRVGTYFNTSDLVAEIPRVMKELGL